MVFDSTFINGNQNDQCVLFLLEHIQEKKTCREKRVYRALNKKYDINSNYRKVSDLLLQQNYIDIFTADDPMEDEPDIPPRTNDRGRVAIRKGVFVSETNIYYGRLWCKILIDVYKAVIKVFKSIFRLEH